MTRAQRPQRPPGTSWFVVLVLDPVCDEIDSYGPYAFADAVAEATRRREEYEREDLGDLLVVVVPLHPGPPVTR